MDESSFKHFIEHMVERKLLIWDTNKVWLGLIKDYLAIKELITIQANQN